MKAAVSSSSWGSIRNEVREADFDRGGAVIHTFLLAPLVFAHMVGHVQEVVWVGQNYCPLYISIREEETLQPRLLSGDVLIDLCMLVINLQHTHSYCKRNSNILM